MPRSPNARRWPALLIGLVAVLIALWSWLARPLSAALDRGRIAGLESEPFFPAPDPGAAAVLGAARLVLTELAAGSRPSTDQELGARFPALDALEPGPWLLTLYVPTKASHRGPHLAPVDAGVAVAAASLFAALPPIAQTPELVRRTRLKLDRVLPGRRPLPPDGGYSGVAVDIGLDGVSLSHGDSTYLYLPSWAAETGIKRRHVVREAGREARSRADWSKADVAAARIEAFRTRAWVELPDGTSIGSTRANADPGPVDAPALRRAIGAGASYMAREVGSSGKMTYVFQAETGEVGGGYNLLRHAGSAYSMFQAYRLSGDAEVFDAAARSMRWFKRQMREDEAFPGEWFALESFQKRHRAKLGGAGLALLAWVEMEKARPGSADMEAMFGLARHVARMQQPDGSFVSFYDWDGLETTTRKSTFYPGEALLALVRLEQLTGEGRWLDVAERGADYLVHRRWVSLGLRLYVPPDAWLLQALEELDRVRPDDARANYAFQIADQIARHKLMDPATTPPDLLGGDLSGIGTLPFSATAGSFGEALTAAARLEARRRPTRGECRTWAEKNAGFQMRNQFSERNDWFLPDPARAHGGFRARPNDHEIRNDHVQHNISGLFGLLQLVDPSAPDIGEVIAPEARSPALVQAMSR